MGLRYYTSVSFPTTALRIDEIRDACHDQAIGSVSCEDHLTSPGITVYSAEERNYGNLDEITDLLDEHKVPYDHYHEMSEGSTGGPWTDHIRWSYYGARIEIETNPEVDTEIAMAGELKKLLDAGDLDGLRSSLDASLAKKPRDLADLGWEPA